MLVFLAAVAQASTDPLLLLQAMEIEEDDLVDGSATLASLLSDSAEVLPALGVLEPHGGDDFAVLATGRILQRPQPGYDLGRYGSADDSSTLVFTLMSPDDAGSFALDFFFLSAEYPEYVGTQYNDHFNAYVAGSAWTGDAAIDNSGNPISVNSAMFTVTEPIDLEGTKFEVIGGGTGWLTLIVPVNPNEMIDVVFTIYDVSDGIYDSEVVLDDFRWQEDHPDEPQVIEQVSIDWLEPKRGPVDGGQDTAIRGTKFNPDCAVTFDGIPTDSHWVGPDKIVATPPPHDIGLVDVAVICPDTEDTLLGGYTYYAEANDDLAPVIDSLDPFQVPSVGHVWVDLAGENFVDGAVVSVDGTAAETAFVDVGQVRFMAPEHVAGLATVTVTNPDGLSDSREGAVYFVDDPGTGDGTGETGVPRHTCDTSGSSFGMGILFALALVRRRR